MKCPVINELLIVARDGNHDCSGDVGWRREDAQRGHIDVLGDKHLLFISHFEITNVLLSKASARDG